MQMNGQPSGEARRGLWFGLTVDATCELAHNADRVGALVRVAAQQSEHGATAASGTAEVIIMDRSQSMHRSGKLQQAKRAVAAAIDALSEGTYFAVVAGTHGAEQVYPGDGGLKRAGAREKAEAKVQVASQVASGGTAMGAWLTLAGELLNRYPDAVRHAVLYTDGINEHETPEQLDSALRACRDRFVCDVRGVGTDWDHRELRRIGNALQGGTEAIIDIADLRDDFTRLMAHAEQLLVPRARLRLTLDRRFRLESLRQIRPTEHDLTEHRLPQDGGIVDIPLLAWGEETRDYLVVLRTDPATLPREEVRAARVDMIAEALAGEQPVPCATPVAVTVRRLDYGSEPSVSPVGVTEVEELVRLGAATRAGIDAYERGEPDLAVREFTVAVGIALRLGATRHLERLLRLVTIDEHDRVRLRPDIGRADLLITSTGSTAHPVARQPAVEVPGARPAERVAVRRTCPRGHLTVGMGVRYCEEAGCDHEFSGDPEPSRG
jgi:von Willebrand factor type A domain